MSMLLAGDLLSGGQDASQPGRVGVRDPVLAELAESALDAVARLMGSGAEKCLGRGLRGALWGG